MADPTNPIFGIKTMLNANVIIAPKIDRYAPKMVFPINLYHIDRLKKIPKKRFANKSIETTRNPLSSWYKDPKNNTMKS